MKWWRVAVVLMSSVSVADAGESRQLPLLDLQLINDTRVSPDVLERALDQVTHIYADAGVTVRWIDTARVRVHIVMHVIGYGQAGSPVMGVAFRRPEGPKAQVFLKPVQEFARVFRVDVSTLLAHVIAHEVGHLVLGTVHTPTGLMQAGWDKALVRDVTGRPLAFTAAQAEKIRAYR